MPFGVDEVASLGRRRSGNYARMLRIPAEHRYIRTNSKSEANEDVEENGDKLFHTGKLPYRDLLCR